MAERCIYADDFLDLFHVASAGQDKMFVKVVEQVVEELIKCLVKSSKLDCTKCWQRGENCEGDDCEKVIAEKILAIYNQQQVEIEKLKTEVKQVKTKTVKEFKEKLQATFPDREDKRCTLDDCYTLDLINSIAEEMVGEKNEKSY